MNLLAEFLTEEKNVYNKFKDTSKVREGGIMPADAVLKGQTGYLVILRHPESVTEKVGKFSARIAREVPAIVYRKEIVHTTVSDYMLEAFRPDFSPDENLLDNLCNSIYNTANTENGCTTRTPQ